MSLWKLNINAFIVWEFYLFSYVSRGLKPHWFYSLGRHTKRPRHTTPSPTARPTPEIQTYNFMFLSISRTLEIKDRSE